MAQSQLVQGVTGRPVHRVDIRNRVLEPRGAKTISAGPVRCPMDYPPRVRALLDRAQAEGGDTAVVRAKGERHEGTLMPHHGFTREDILPVKLPSGYNIGTAVGAIEAVEVPSND